MSKKKPNKGRMTADTDLPNKHQGCDDEDCIGETIHDIIDKVKSVFTGSVNQSDTLRVLTVNLNIEKNNVLHFTSKYDIKEYSRLVVRRGKPFFISMTLSRPYDKLKDDLRIVLRTGRNPKPGQGTYVSLKLKENVSVQGWEANIIGMDQNELDIQITSPPNCAVSRWNMERQSHSNGGRVVHIYTQPEITIDVIFNAWNKDDSVYVEDDDRREEYVLNDAGCIYVGDKTNIRARPWIFGQFEDKVLDCAFYLLDKSSLSWNARRDPVMVCRKLSAMGNSVDDNGVIEAKWSSNDKEGSKATKWTGSVVILQKYFKTKTPVKYGQCWVFSGVLTTLCRALGIPTRSVTNYESAHDTDGNMTIDRYTTEDGQPIEDIKKDTIWAFHVWNEVWMLRHDLPPGYGGWQVIDSTPHQKSDGIFQCGPIPVEAIKNGEISLPYDGRFVFSEVNADFVTMVLDRKTGVVKLSSVSTSRVGHKISTKRAGQRPDFASFEEMREDITDDYKFPEGSPEERAAVIKASQSISKPGIYYPTIEKDVSFTLHQQKTSLIGEPISVHLETVNNSKHTRNVGGRLEVRSVYYTGVPHKKIFSHSFNIVLPPANRMNREKVTAEFLELPFERYDGLLAEHSLLQVSCVMRVKETNQIFMEEYMLGLVKPKLTVQVKPKEVRVDEPITVDITFDNPLPKTLSKCELAVEGPGLHKTLKIGQRNVDPKKKFHASIGISAAKEGEKEIVATFNAAELSDVTGYCKLMVIKEVQYL